MNYCENFLIYIWYTLLLLRTQGLQSAKNVHEDKNMKINDTRHEKTRFFAYAKTKTQISFAVTAKLIIAFVFATQIVQSLYYLNPKFQASNHLLSQYSLVCVGPGRKPQRLVFSQRGSNNHKKKIGLQYSPCIRFQLFISLVPVNLWERLSTDVTLKDDIGILDQQ